MTEKVKERKKTPEEIAEEKRLERNRKAREYYWKIRLAEWGLKIQ